MTQDERDYWYNPKQFRNKNSEFPENDKAEAYSIALKETSKKFSGYLASVIATIIGIATLMWFFNIGITKVMSNMSNKVVAQQQQNIEQKQQRSKQLFLEAQATSSAVKKQEAEQAEVRRRIETAQPHYEQILVKAKSSRECRKDNVITNESIKCMKDHYEMVLVSGNQ